MSAATLSPGTISQVCYATFDLQAAAKRWARLSGAGPFFVMDLPAEIVKTYRGKPAKDTFRAAIGFMGMTCIELMQPTNDAPSIVREILETRGEGAVQHIYPQIRPLDAAQYDAVCTGYREQGLVEALSFKLEGLGRNAFYDATESLGCFIEVLEVGEAAYHTVLGGMYSAHRDWDGNEIFHSMESLTERRIA